MSNIQTVVIESVIIRQDVYGRYCLNDLHRAAGGDPKDKPSNWLRLDQTQALIAEIEASSDPISYAPLNKATPFSDMSTPSTEMRIAPVGTINDGLNNGTYVVNDLVYAYATWISAKFHLIVLRAYSDLVEGRKQMPQAQSYEHERVSCWTRMVVDVLNLQGSARLGYVKNVLQKFEPSMLPTLPAYAIDAPRLPDGTLVSTGEGASSKATLAVTDCVTEYSPWLTRNKVFAAMKAKGLMERLKRSSTSSKTGYKEFNSLTAEGLRFGKNLSFDGNDKETQVHIYRDSYLDMLEFIGLPTTA
jgi:hypothetical protein